MEGLEGEGKGLHGGKRVERVFGVVSEFVSGSSGRFCQRVKCLSVLSDSLS